MPDSLGNSATLFSFCQIQILFISREYFSFSLPSIGDIIAQAFIVPSLAQTDIGAWDEYPYVYRYRGLGVMRSPTTYQGQCSLQLILCHSQDYFQKFHLA